MTNEGMLSLLTSDIFQINACLKNITDNYVIIGKILSETKRRETIEKTNFKGYKNIAEFALAEFGFEKTKTYNLISVYEKFFMNNKNPEYKNFKFTHLRYMLNMTDEQLQKCNFQMTVKEIKEIIVNKNDFSARAESEDIANTQNMLKNNVIEGVFPDKKVDEEPEQKQNTIIVTELPKPERMENKTITIEVKSEQNNDFVTSSEIDYRELYLMESAKNVDLNMNILDEKNKTKKVQQQLDNCKSMLNYIYDSLYFIHEDTQNENIHQLSIETNNFIFKSLLPEKIHFMKNVI